MSLLVTLLFGSIAVGTAAAILAWRARPNPGALPLVWLLAGQSWWSTCIVFTLSAGTVGEKLLWTKAGWIGVMIVPVAWLLFVLEYTGRDEYITRRYASLLLIVPVLTVLLATTAPYHDLLYVRPAGLASDGVVFVEQGGPWYWVAAAYTYLLATLGALPILRFLSSPTSAFRGQSAALLVGVVTPWITNLLYNAGVLPIASIDPTPIAFAVSGVAYLAAIDRFRMFGANPAPTWRAKQYLFDHIHEGAIVVDGNNTIVEMNETGAEILDVSMDRAIGTEASDILPANDAFRTDGGGSDYLTVGTETTSRSYDVTVTELTDRRGTTLGHVFTLHNVTQYLRQQQRLKVLNRTLRHNIRTETNIIHGYAERTDADTAETIKHRAMRIVEISDKGRDAVELFEDATGNRETRSLVGLLDGRVDVAREAFPDAGIELEYPNEDVPVPGVLSIVIDNLVENAAVHNEGDTCRVTVTAEVDDDHVRIRVADDGPGIDDYELDVLDSGTETALQHGSGLGLWLVKWGTEIVGGSVSFDRNEPTGTVVTATVPWGDRDDPRVHAGEPATDRSTISR